MCHHRVVDPLGLVVALGLKSLPLKYSYLCGDLLLVVIFSRDTLIDSRNIGMALYTRNIEEWDFPSLM